MEKLCAASDFIKSCEKSGKILEKHFLTQQKVDKDDDQAFGIEHVETEFNVELEDDTINDNNDQNEEAEVFECKICNTLYKEEFLLCEHLSDEHNPEDQELDSLEVINEEDVIDDNKSPNDEIATKEKPPEIGKYECEKCGKHFKGSSRLKQHLNIHNEKNAFTCDVCGRGYRSKLYMERHRKAMHTVSHHTCSHCNQEFDNTAKYEYHLKSHDPNKKYKCQYCPKSFLQRHHCDNHERTHTKERPYLCSICGNNFNCPSTLHLHLQIHRGEKPYKCDECDKGFFQKPQLRYHKRGVHGNQPMMKPKPDMNSDLALRKHPCTECGSSFKRPEHLKSHINGVHLKHKPFACEVRIDRNLFLSKLKSFYNYFVLDL